jgi:hypothetical protein
VPELIHSDGKLSPANGRVDNASCSPRSSNLRFDYTKHSQQSPYHREEESSQPVKESPNLATIKQRRHISSPLQTRDIIKVCVVICNSSGVLILFV